MKNFNPAAGPQEKFDESSYVSAHTLKTKSLHLRPIGKADLADYVKLLTDPAVMRFIGLEAGYIPSPEEIEQIVFRAVDAWQTRGYGRWSLYFRETGEFAGFCGFRCEQGRPELICLLHEKFWGRGLALESSRACLDYGFARLAFTEVQAFTRAANDRAHRLLEKLGAQFVGHIDFYGVEGDFFLIEP